MESNLKSVSHKVSPMYLDAFGSGGRAGCPQSSRRVVRSLSLSFCNDVSSLGEILNPILLLMPSLQCVIDV